MVKLILHMKNITQLLGARSENGNRNVPFCQKRNVPKCLRTCIMKKLNVDIPADMVHISSSGICTGCKWSARLRAFFKSNDVFYSK